MEKFNKIFFSRTIWTIVLMFFIGGVQELKSFFTPEAFIAIQGGLSVLATYFKLFPSQSY